MTYLTQDAIAQSWTMQHRVAAAYAQETADAPGPYDPQTGEALPDPDMWSSQWKRYWSAAPGWDAAWESALVAHPPEEGEPEYDPGADPAVITDGMILSQVQAMLA